MQSGPKATASRLRKSSEPALSLSLSIPTRPFSHFGIRARDACNNRDIVSFPSPIAVCPRSTQPSEGRFTYPSPFPFGMTAFLFLLPFTHSLVFALAAVALVCVALYLLLKSKF